MTLVRIYKALLLAGFQQAAQYRVQSLLWMLFSIVRPVIFLAAWVAVAVAQGGDIAGYKVGDFAAYYVCMTFVSQLVMAWNSHEFEWEVNQGRLSAKLLRPLHPLHYSVVDNLIFKLNTLPVLGVILILVSISFGAINWVIASLAFWATRMRTANTLFQRATFVFAGQIAPIALLPGWLQTLSYALPFWYMMGAPTEILRGGVTQEQVLQILAGQSAWLVVTVVAFQWIWRRGVRAYSAVGA
jgi:ABC-2 type transport system permease protein